MPAFTGRASGLPLVARARPFTQGTARQGHVVDPQLFEDGDEDRQTGRKHRQPFGRQALQRQLVNAAAFDGLGLQLVELLGVSGHFLGDLVHDLLGLVALALFFLLLREPDFGAFVVITKIAFGVLFLGGVNVRVFVLLAVVAVLVNQGRCGHGFGKKRVNKSRSASEQAPQGRGVGFVSG